MGYISKVKIPSETEAYDIFADKSLKDGDGNVISTTYLKTADAPKIGTADTDNELKKIEYTEESAVPASPDAGTEYACTDLIGYNDLDSNLQEKIDSAISGAGITAGNGIVIDKNEAGDGVEIKVDPNKKYLAIGDIADTWCIPVKNPTQNIWGSIYYDSIATPNKLVQRDANGDFAANEIALTSIPSAANSVARIADVGQIIKLTSSGTSGTLTAAQLTLANIPVTDGTYNNTWILFNNERYYPMSYEKTAGHRTYVCSTPNEVKMISVNTTSGAWALTKADLPKTNNFVKKIRLSEDTAFSIAGTGDAQIKPNSIYIITGWKDTGLAKFTLGHRDGTINAQHAIAFVDDIENSYGFAITGSIVISELAKTFINLQSCVPASGGFLQVYRVALDNT